MTTPDPIQPPEPRAAEIDPDFAALLARAAEGDSKALGELTQKYEAKVRLVARVLLGRSLRPYIDSVDLLQSVHQSVLIGLRNQAFDVSDPSKLTALAVTIVRRKVARHWRRVQRQQRVSLMDRSPAGDAPDLFATIKSNENEPGAAMQSRDQIERLCRDLSDIDRAILDLRMQGLSTADIAERLSLRPVALRVRLTRLRQRLQSEHISGDWL